MNRLHIQTHIIYIQLVKRNMDWAKAYLFPKVKWVDDDREWVVANSFSTKSMQNDIVYFELRGNDRSIHTGVYDPIRGTVKLYTKSSPPIIWMGNVSNIKNGTVEWNVMSGPHIKWTGGSGDRWLAKNWSEICMKYGALTTIIAGGIGISVKALLRNRAMSDGGGGPSRSPYRTPSRPNKAAMRVCSPSR